MEVAALIRQALDADPSLTAADLAARIGVSRQRIYQVLKGSGMRPGRPSLLHQSTERKSPQPPINLSCPQGVISHTAAGTVAELLAAADLTARGWHVFFPFVRTTHADLLATSRDGLQVIKIEVRPAVRRGERLMYQKKDNTTCDHYALVTAGEPVAYLPDLPS